MWVDKVYILNKDLEMKKTYFDPRRYLGENVVRFDLLYVSVTSLYRSVVDYSQNTADSVSTMLTETDSKLYGKTYSVICTGCFPDLDVLPVLNSNQ